MCGCRGDRAVSQPASASVPSPKRSCWEVTYPDGSKAEGKFLDPVTARKEARRRGIGSTVEKVSC